MKGWPPGTPWIWPPSDTPWVWPPSKPSIGDPGLPPLPVSAVEYWHGERGASAANAIGQIAGTAIPGVNSPTVVSDAPHFNGRPVYFTLAAGAGSKYWAQPVLPTPLLSVGNRLYMCAIFRTRNVIAASSLYTAVSVRGGNHSPVGELIALTYDTNKYGFQRFRSGAANNVLSLMIQDTGVHFFECYVDATAGMVLFIDGVQYGGNAETAGLVSQIDALSIGVILTGAGIGVVDTSRTTNTSLAFWIICSALPAAGERAALRAWGQAYWGSP